MSGKAKVVEVALAMMDSLAPPEAEELRERVEEIRENLRVKSRTEELRGIGRHQPYPPNYLEDERNSWD